VIQLTTDTDPLSRLQKAFDDVQSKAQLVLPKADFERLLGQIEGVGKFLSTSPLRREDLIMAEVTLSMVQTTLNAALVQQQRADTAEKLAIYEHGRANNHRDEARRYKALSETDPLTKLPSRHGFNYQIERAIKLNGTEIDPIKTPKLKRYFGLMIMDFDRFKGVNDGLGHPAGDQALKIFGEHLLFHTRLEHDLDDVRGTASRLGGDEFTLILEVTAESPQEAQDYLSEAHDKIRERFSGLHATFDNHVIPIVVSSGMHTINEDDTVLSAYQSADEALDHFKNSNPARKAQRYEEAVKILRDQGHTNIFAAQDLRAPNQSSPSDPSPA
jgi:diguanylate cyclase (GGDEF)-like protein